MTDSSWRGPALVIAALTSGVLAVVGLTGWVLPKFRDFFSSLGAKLPLPTRIMLAIGQSAVSWWFLYLPASIVLGFLASAALRRRR
jgi:type IV pilus assembly protein PilC